MHVSEYRESRFLRKEDLMDPQTKKYRPVLVTIEKCESMNVAMQGAQPEMKRCIWFKELDKPMTCNATNAGAIVNAAEQQGLQKPYSEDDDYWGENPAAGFPGVKVVLYVDPNVMFQGKLIGGLRIRPPKQGAASVATAPNLQAAQAIQRQQQQPQGYPGVDFRKAMQRPQQPPAGYPPRAPQPGQPPRHVPQDDEYTPPPPPEMDAQPPMEQPAQGAYEEDDVPF